jgi:hypothetical protein
MNTLISKLMDQGIMQSPFENWQDQNRCEAIAYCSEHFNALPYGELGQLIAEQAMDAGRTKIKPEPMPSDCDAAFASDAWKRGTAEVNSFMGFDYDEATTHGSASDQMEIQDLHNTAPALTHVVGLRTYLKLSGNPKMREGLRHQIALGRKEHWTPKQEQLLNTTLSPVDWTARPADSHIQAFRWHQKQRRAIHPLFAK